MCPGRKECAASLSCKCPPHLRAADLGETNPESPRLPAKTAGSVCAPSIPRKCEAEFLSGWGEGGGKGLRNNREAAGRSQAAAGSSPSCPGLHPHLKRNPSLARREGDRGDPGSRLQTRFCSERQQLARREVEDEKLGGSQRGKPTPGQKTNSRKISPGGLKLGGPSYHVIL